MIPYRLRPVLLRSAQFQANRRYHSDFIFPISKLPGNTAAIQYHPLNVFHRFPGRVYRNLTDRLFPVVNDDHTFLRVYLKAQPFRDLFHNLCRPECAQCHRPRILTVTQIQVPHFRIGTFRSYHLTGKRPRHSVFRGFIKPEIFLPAMQIGYGPCFIEILRALPGQDFNASASVFLRVHPVYLDIGTVGPFQNFQQIHALFHRSVSLIIIRLYVIRKIAGISYRIYSRSAARLFDHRIIRSQLFEHGILLDFHYHRLLQIL